LVFVLVVNLRSQRQLRFELQLFTKTFQYFRNIQNYLQDIVFRATRVGMAWNTPSMNLPARIPGNFLVFHLSVFLDSDNLLLCKAQFSFQ